MTLDELRARARIDRGGYRVFDGEFAQMSVTLEDAEFLHALVRLVKPRRVLELGTGLGVSARFIAEALAENGNDATLLTIEPNLAAFGDDARSLLEGCPGVEVATAARDTGLLPRDGSDIVFIDSGYEHRPGDIKAWLANGYRGLVVVHDANREYADLELGVGAFLPCSDGMWLGRARA